MSISKEQLKEWKSRVAPKLIQISGVNGVEMGKVGLMVRVEKSTLEVQQKIMEVMERECGEDIVYGIKVVGRHVSIS